MRFNSYLKNDIRFMKITIIIVRLSAIHISISWNFVEITQNLFYV